MELSKLFTGVLAASFLAGVGMLEQSAQADTLSDVRNKGRLSCIINTGLTGFAYKNDQGRWEGFDVETCRAVAAAVLDNPDSVSYIPATTKNRFTLLASGEGELLSRNTTWTLSRDADLGLSFAVTTFYDGQGFIVPRSLGVTQATELDGASICIQSGTTTELNLADFFRANNISYEPVSIETSEEGKVAYENGRCDSYTTDRSALAALRSSLASPSAHVILPDVISKEPLAPAVRDGDENWSDIVTWVLYGLIEAEELGVTSSNIDSLRRNASALSPQQRRLLGIEGSMGEYLGLSPDFMVKVIKATGNYGEIFDRYLTPIGLARDLNALYTDGGLQYSPPFR